MHDQRAWISSFAKAFNPYTATSGTEAMAHLLYAMVRMTRPRTIVEYGPGHTTLFLLQALAHNAADEVSERAMLLQKTLATGVLESVPVRADNDRSPWTDAEKAIYRQWFYQDGAAQEQGLEPFFVAHYGRGFSPDAVPADHLPVDLAWNDCDEYRAFFQDYWPQLNARGGIMVFHNATAWTPLYEDIQWMRRERECHADLELIMLDEPHKLNQNGCAVLRRVSGRPEFVAERPNAVLNALRSLAGPTGERGA